MDFSEKSYILQHCADVKKMGLLVTGLWKCCLKVGKIHVLKGTIISRRCFRTIFHFTLKLICFLPFSIEVSRAQM